MLILLVDDDKEARETMGLILEMDGMQVLHAGTGREALKRLNLVDEAHPQVDLMVLDLEMADISGLELLAELKLLKRSVPIIVVTGFATKKTVVELLRYGVVDYMDKPVQMKDFSARVKGKLRTMQLTEEQRGLQK